MSELKKLPMPIGHALSILAHVHTRDDAIGGFAIMTDASPDRYNYGPMRSMEEYIEAWRVVREAAGLPTKPEQYV